MRVTSKILVYRIPVVNKFSIAISIGIISTVKYPIFYVVLVV